MNLVQSLEMMGKDPPSSPPGSPAEGWLADKAPGSPSSLLLMVAGETPPHAGRVFPRLTLGPGDYFPATPKKGDDLDLAKAAVGPRGLGSSWNVSLGFVHGEVPNNLIEGSSGVVLGGRQDGLG